MTDEREFRIFVESHGDEPVRWGIMGEKNLEESLRGVRAEFPNKMIAVREVMETVVRIIRPDGTVIHLDS